MRKNQDISLDKHSFTVSSDLPYDSRIKGIFDQRNQRMRHHVMRKANDTARYSIRMASWCPEIYLKRVMNHRNLDVTANGEK